MGNRQIYLCFNDNPAGPSGIDADRKCRTANGPFGNFAEIKLSAYGHGWSQVSASECKFLLMGLCKIVTLVQMLAVGSDEGVEAELYDDASDSWLRIDDYPFSESGSKTSL